MNVPRILFAGAALMSLYALPALADPEFAVTREGREFLFDYVAEKNSEITALGFRVDIGDIDPEHVDLSNCTAGIPDTHMGFCKANPGFIKVLVYSNDNSVLETSHIGSIAVSANAERSGDAGSRRAQQREGQRELSRESILRGDDGKRGVGVLGQVKVQNLNYSDRNANDIKGEVLQ